MQERLHDIQRAFERELEEVNTKAELEAFEEKYFGRKQSVVGGLMKELASLSGEEKKDMGQKMNSLKTELTALLDAKKQALLDALLAVELEKETIDVTEPRLPPVAPGRLHPLTTLRIDVEDFFARLGFRILAGPELESDYYNFTSVNVPPNHPARDMQDTFYIDGHSDWVMRTHTTSVQVRAMRQYGAPLQMISIGRVFRNEATDVRHEHTFYQLEGLMVGKDISFAHLKAILLSLAKHLYGENTEIRLRPKFYPFVEPGVNGEVTCYLCKGKGCRLCKHTGWLEIFGAGMVHPNVLKEGGIDAETHTGFAFGFGFNRVAMLRYGIEDVRHFQSGDLRFLTQF